MARYVDAACRKCRREGMKLFLKGERCFSPKCAIEKRNLIPGQHGRSRRGKLSNYALQLREKQKLRSTYGVMEKQFKIYYNNSVKKKGVTGDNLIKFLERRLDNVVYRLGFALSRSQARQLVDHRHFEVNGHIVNIPSFIVKPGDEIRIKEKSRDKVPFKAAIEVTAQRSVPTWLERQADGYSGKVIGEPARENLDIPIDESLIIEYYSR